MAVEEEMPRTKERRRPGVSFAGNPVLWCKVIGYLFFLVALSYVHVAKPLELNVFHHAYNVTPNSEWNLDLLFLSWTFLWLTLLVGTVGLLLNVTQLRRKKDHLSVGLIVLLVMTLGVAVVVPAGNSLTGFLMGY